MNILEKFDVLYEDEEMVVINKPYGILVHRTRISEDVVSVLALLRDQIGRRLYPVHRLDRGTSGVLVFGKTKEAASHLNSLFRSRQVQKEYMAIIRGYVPENECIDYPLAPDKGKEARQAVTDFSRISQTEMDFSVGKYPRSRYSLVRIHPQTGRFHQIRRHFSHIRHPIIGDKRHGDCKHNKYFCTALGIDRMLLHANQIRFQLPYRSEPTFVEAPLGSSFLQAIKMLRL